VGRVVLVAVDTGQCPVISAILSQFLSAGHHLSVCERQDLDFYLAISQPLGDEFQWHSHSHCRILSYEIFSHVNLLYDRLSHFSSIPCVLQVLYLEYLSLPLFYMVQRYKIVTSSFSMGSNSLLCSAKYNLLKCEAKCRRLFERLPRTHAIVTSKAVSDDSARP
jgi:hypothetical protein